MSYGTSGDGRLSKNEKREAARDKARLLREEQRKKDRRTTYLVQGGVILGTLAIVGIVALILINSVRPPSAGPLNMASDGIQFGQGAVATETIGLPAGEDPEPNVRNEAAGVLDIQIYVDYLCPFCADFEATNGEYIASLMDNGQTTVEIHPISILDSQSQGAKYSTRATNAVACVANFSPNSVYDFHTALFDNQPEEGTPGLSDDELVALTEAVKVEGADPIAACIRSEEFKGWVKDASARALNNPIPGTDGETVIGTPTIVVNGLKYDGPIDDLEAFQDFVIRAAAATAAEPVPTPTPIATP